MFSPLSFKKSRKIKRRKFLLSKSRDLKPYSWSISKDSVLVPGSKSQETTKKRVKAVVHFVVSNVFAHV